MDKQVLTTTIFWQSVSPVFDSAVESMAAKGGLLSPKWLKMAERVSLSVSVLITGGLVDHCWPWSCCRLLQGLNLPASWYHAFEGSLVLQATKGFVGTAGPAFVHLKIGPSLAFSGPTCPSWPASLSYASAWFGCEANLWGEMRMFENSVELLSQICLSHLNTLGSFKTSSYFTKYWLQMGTF